MKDESAPVVCIACSIFKMEIQHLLQEKEWDIPCRFLGSMLHMAPERLGAELQTALAEALQGGDRVVLAYGDCCPQMEDLGSQGGVARTEGVNCCEILLGREDYQRMRKEGVFFLIPEWTLNWRRIFEHELGLKGINAVTFMQEMHTRFVYLDTGRVPIPTLELEEISVFAGLPVEILPISLDHLLASLETAAGKVCRHGR